MHALFRKFLDPPLLSVIGGATLLHWSFLYFSPYSPDLNPIEEAFGCGKAWLQRHADKCAKYPKQCFEMALDQVHLRALCHLGTQRVNLT